MLLRGLISDPLILLRHRPSLHIFLAWCLGTSWQNGQSARRTARKALTDPTQTEQILLVEQSFLEMRSFPPVPQDEPSTPEDALPILFAQPSDTETEADSDAETRLSALFLSPPSPSPPFFPSLLPPSHTSTPIPHPILHPDVLLHILHSLPPSALSTLLQTHPTFGALARPALYAHITVDLAGLQHPLKARYLPLPLRPRLSAPHSGHAPRWDFCTYPHTRQHTARDPGSACSEGSWCLSEPPSPSFTSVPLQLPEPAEPTPNTVLPYTHTLTVKHHRSHSCAHYHPPRVPGLDTLHFQMSNDDFLSWSFCRPQNRSRYPYYPISTYCPLLVELQPRRMIVSDVGTVFSFTPFAEWFPKGKYDGHTRLLAKLQEVVLRIDLARWRGTAHRSGGDFLCCLAERVGKVTIFFNVPPHLDPKRGPYGERNLLAEIIDELFLLGVLSKPGTRRRYVVAGLEEMVRREQAALLEGAQEEAYQGKGKGVAAEVPEWTETGALETLRRKMADLVQQKKDDYGDVGIAESLPDRIEWVSLKELRARTSAADKVMTILLDF